MLVIEGVVREFRVKDHIREYIMVTMTLGDAWKYTRPNLFTIQTGEGEQRGVVESHIKKLVRECRQGNFTPTPWTAALLDGHRERLEYEEGPPRRVRLEVSEDQPLSLPDASHRRMAFKRLLDTGEMSADCPVDVLVLLAGNTRQDFVNLQSGRPVESSHLLSIRILNGMLGQKEQPACEMAQEIAGLLNDNKRSRFYRKIRFGSTGSYPIRFSTIMGRAPSDSSTSLVGLGRLALAFEQDRSTGSKLLAGLVNTLADRLVEEAPDLAEEMHRHLTLPPDHSLCSLHLFLGVTVLAAYETLRLRQRALPDAVFQRLVACARQIWPGEVYDSSLSAPLRRKMMGQFARHFYAGESALPGGNHEGLPVELLQIISTSAYDASKLPDLRGVEIETAS